MFNSLPQNNSVFRFDGTTGAFIDEFASLDVPGIDSTPTDLVFGPDGNLYINGMSATGTGIYRFDGETGNFIDAYIPEGSAGLSRLLYGMLFVDPGCSRYSDGGLGNRCFTPPSAFIDIDIKPGSDPNSINLKSKGIIPVAILSTNEFDAGQVNPDTVTFGPNNASEFHKVPHMEDVDGDGDYDQVFHFKTQETGIACGDTEATLTGETFDGTQISGTDTIKTVGCD